MGPTPYIPSFVLLEEHRQRHRPHMPVSEQGAAITAPAKHRRPVIRLRLARMLRALADRIDPVGARARDMRLFVIRDIKSETGKGGW